MVVIGGDMDEFFSLLLDGLYNLGVAVTGGDYSDPGGEIEETVTINIPHFGAFSMIHHEGIASRVRRGNHRVVTRDDLPGFRPW
jgi:hypothetical protein